MAMIELGVAPQVVLAHLSSDADFLSQLQAIDSDGNPTDWLAGETLTLEFAAGATWVADIAADMASWDVPQAEVAALIAAMQTTANRRVRLLYHADPDVDITWGAGNAIIE